MNINARLFARIKNTTYAVGALIVFICTPGFFIYDAYDNVYTFLIEWRKSDADAAKKAAVSDANWLEEDRNVNQKILDKLDEIHKAILKADASSATRESAQTQALNELTISDIANQRMLADINYRLGILEGRRRSGMPGR